MLKRKGSLIPQPQNYLLVEQFSNELTTFFNSTIVISMVHLRPNPPPIFPLKPKQHLSAWAERLARD